jgi:hypothetical protein
MREQDFLRGSIDEMTTMGTGERSLPRGFRSIKPESSEKVETVQASF